MRHKLGEVDLEAGARRIHAVLAARCAPSPSRSSRRGRCRGQTAISIQLFGRGNALNPLSAVRIDQQVISADRNPYLDPGLTPAQSCSKLFDAYSSRQLLGILSTPPNHFVRH